MFGLILTRLRSRLQGAAMTGLAELRMHLRDEHIHDGAFKERLRKRNITTHSNTISDANSTTNQPAANTPNPDPAETPNESQPTEGEELPQETHHPEPPSSFGAIIDGLVDGAIADDLGEDISRPLDQGSEKKTIQELFDFSNSYWFELVQDTAMRGLAEEMEVYQLVDLDAEGEPTEANDNDITHNIL
ncbi:hypothetical protein BD779DRAFT_1443445 [Infundibulicybe gibba]|nr:hypothetical protein BD779DRAFT_1443445 [Infundibulicybe gibba]